MKIDTSSTTDAKNGSSKRFLIETAELEQALSDPSLRVFDCAVIAGPNPDTERADKFPFAFESGQNEYDKSHIPGAGFIDIVGDLSDTDAAFPLMMPPLHKFTMAMRQYGVSNQNKVVLYSSTEPMWAARVWWMLRAFGFDSAVILNGGLAKWTREGRALSTDRCAYEPGDFTAAPRPALFAGKDDVLTAVEAKGTSVINALPPVMHTGSGGPVFGRKGRIKGSINVPNSLLHDADSGCYLPPEKLRAVFKSAGTDGKIITYCGGGIASSNDAFVLTMLGYENVSVYDASMFEWGNDPSLPMETGETVESQ